MTQTYVPIDDLAKYLSVKVTTVRSWVQKGYIPEDSYIKVGYTYRFDIPAVVEGLKRNQGDIAEKPALDTEQDITDSAPNTPTQLDLFDFTEDDDL
jgi:excisionase family DNA binding protein|tara:strand:+ start:2012 stop:2299 length:288 start_codon:yes stop_codon:yes gene_type:complete